MKRYLCSAVSVLCLLPAVSLAEKVEGAGEVEDAVAVHCLEFPTREGCPKDYGTFEAAVKLQQVVTGEDNGYDPNTGSAYLLKLKYQTPKWNGFGAGLGWYMNGDLFGLTDWDTTPGEDRVARGLFVADRGSDRGLLGEGYVTYKNDTIAFKGGRQMLNTPWTKIAYSTMPNFYTAYMLDANITDGFTGGIGLITEMSYGARAMTDFGLIGEGTPTAGAALRPDTIGQAHFHSIAVSQLGEGAPNTNGITVINAGYKWGKKYRVAAWDYFLDEIANNLYLEAGAVYPVKWGKVKLDAQYLNQTDSGDSLKGDLDYDLFGIRAAFGSKKWSVYAAYNNSSGDTFMFNGFGGDPAYTSSIFSRNAYRENVDAWKVGGSYTIMKGLKFLASYADYGQSDTLGFGGKVASNKDATELDLVLAWKPDKRWLVKTFYADRTSEYDGAGGVERTQGHWRLIAQYSY